MSNKVLFRKLCGLGYNVEYMVQPDRQQGQYNTTHALCMLDT